MFGFKKAVAGVAKEEFECECCGAMDGIVGCGCGAPANAPTGCGCGAPTNENTTGKTSSSSCGVCGTSNEDPAENS